MKKPLLIALIASALLVIIAVILLSSGKKDPVEQPVEKPASLEESSIWDIPDVGEEEANTIVEDEQVIEATSEDIREAIINPAEEAETKFLTTEQKRELNAATIGSSQIRPRVERTYAVSWTTDDFSSVLPELPAQAPVYLLNRPTDESVFDTIRDLATDMGIEGAVLRSNRQKYSVADISKGEYFMTYDMYHLGFDATIMKAPIVGTVKDTLLNWGVLSFPNPQETTSVDSKGVTWHRFSPELELPVVTLDEKDTTEFREDILGEVQAEVDGDNITHVIARFPNVLPKETVDLLDKEGMVAALNTEEFAIGNVELQYPGALSLAEKREFFEASREDTVQITNAEVMDMKCGYYLEDDEVLQALLSPLCIVSGQGKVEGKSALFTVAFPAVQ